MPDRLRIDVIFTPGKLIRPAGWSESKPLLRRGQRQ
jgi:hypothetical protein